MASHSELKAAIYRAATDLETVGIAYDDGYISDTEAERKIMEITTHLRAIVLARRSARR